MTISHGELIQTPEQWELLWSTGFGYYGESDGDYVAIDPSQTLPNNVSSDIQKRLDAIDVDGLDSKDGTIGLQAAQGLAYDVASTGKKVVMIQYSVLSVPSAPDQRAMRWLAMPWECQAELRPVGHSELGPPLPVARRRRSVTWRGSVQVAASLGSQN